MASPSLPISTIAEIAHAKGVYLMVDAAGETFPLEDLTRYIKEGADVQCVATKYIGASQSTGIALGSEEFIHKMFLQTFVGFETANDLAAKHLEMVLLCCPKAFRS